MGNIVDLYWMDYYIFLTTINKFPEEDPITVSPAPPVCGLKYLDIL